MFTQDHTSEYLCNTSSIFNPLMLGKGITNTTGEQNTPTSTETHSKQTVAFSDCVEHRTGPPAIHPLAVLCESLWLRFFAVFLL